MTDEVPFFVARDGAVWACWLDGRPAMKLGPRSDVLEAMEQFVVQSGGRAAEAGASNTAAPAAVAPPEADPPPEPRQPTPGARRREEAEAPPRKHEGNERIETRHDTSILGRVRTASGPRDVTVLDLSEKGCRFLNRFGSIADGTPVTIKLGPIGPIDATVRWCRGDYVGLEFNAPLYPSVLDHIRLHFDVRR